ncbi:hypothetical protein EAO74_05525 [Streptomyces sp. gb1(2016)]|uniref:Uncharacterized protein n=1 Tax=Streptomyces sp. gb1(2016) TaxID=1828321 RepID=A0A652LA00_9ACTN|nr:hypothetical protein EAO74_05525 [Streptomyces sp. gb1(2016)]
MKDFNVVPRVLIAFPGSQFPPGKSIFGAIQVLQEFRDSTRFLCSGFLFALTGKQNDQFTLGFGLFWGVRAGMGGGRGPAGKLAPLRLS